MDLSYFWMLEHPGKRLDTGVYEPKNKKSALIIQSAFRLEVGGGFEPPYTVLQTVA